MHGTFYRPKTKVLYEVVNLFFLFTCASATKNFERSKAFRYGWQKIFWVRWKKPTCIRGLITCVLIFIIALSLQMLSNSEMNFFATFFFYDKYSTCKCNCMKICSKWTLSWFISPCPALMPGLRSGLDPDPDHIIEKKTGSGSKLIKSHPQLFLWK